jgi:hypothetical protein
MSLFSGLRVDVPGFRFVFQEIGRWSKTVGDIFDFRLVLEGEGFVAVICGLFFQSSAY